MAQLGLGALSRSVLDELAQAQNLEFGRRTAGKLVLYRKDRSFRSARSQAHDSQQVLTPAECLAFEPSLRLPAHEIMGGIFTRDEQVGDCYAFCCELGTRLRSRNNVDWRMATNVRRALVKSDSLCAVDTDAGEVVADLFVLALGPQAPVFTRSAGFDLPIYPMKGHSITARPRAGGLMLDRSVTDYDRKMAFAPLTNCSGPVVRVTGGADLVGYDRRENARSIAHLKRNAEVVLDLDLSDDLRPWAGLRPATPDGRPIIGWSPVRGLFLNVGHGSLGWTLACGSARLAAELIEEAPPSVEPGWFALQRTG